MSGTILKFLGCCSVFSCLVGFAGEARAQSTIKSPTLEAVKQRGQLNCGVDTGMPGYAFQNSAGQWDGLDVSLCRAVAAAVLGDPDKVKYVGLTSKVRFTVLQSGEIDMLIRDSTLTFTRNTQLGLNEAVINFYTGETFMVRKNLNVAHVKELDGATMCVITGTTLERDIADYGRANHVKINTLLFDRPEEAFAAANAGRCDGYTDDGGSVAAARSGMQHPDDWVILPEVISREPLGAFVRQGDEPWSNIVKWTHYSMVEAEALGITQANVEEIKKTTEEPEARKFLGLEGDFGKMLGLDNDWSYRIVKSVGNYGEVYDRYFGPKALGLPRGLNELWNHGGLQYALAWQ